MIIEQAVFGEVRGGHGVRAAGPGVPAPAELAPRLDLPDTAPPGVAWTPFVSGFRYRDSFVLARTFPDKQASRAGLVVSHALLAPLDEIVHAADLRPLFARLATTAAGIPEEVRALDVQPGGHPPPPPAELPAVAAALAGRGAGPVVRPGTEGFDDVVSALWGRLPPAIRRGFAFRLSFGPGDVVETPPPTLVCTPPALITRWWHHRVTTDPAAPGDSLVAALLDGRDDGRALFAFARRIGAEPAGVGELLLLEQAYRQAVPERVPLAGTVTAVRLVERLSGEAGRGAEGKRELLDRLRHGIGSAAAEELRPLRNLGLTGFEQPERVWQALAARVAAGFSAAEDPAARALVADAADPAGSTPAWREAVLRGLSEADATTLARALWRWAGADPARVAPLWTAAGADGRLADVLVDTAPDDLPAAAAAAVLDLARDRRLPRLHGLVAGLAHPPAEAVRRQLAVEPAPGIAGLRLALRRATPGEVVACAVATADPRLIVLAAEHVAAEPGLLAAVDLADHTARRIWSAALDREPSAWTGPADPRTCFATILEDLLDGRPVVPGLVERLAGTPLADLSGFARRTEVWAVVPSPAVAALLAATARGWLDRLATTEPEAALEPELRDAVQRDPRLGRVLAGLVPDRIDTALRVIGMLPGYPQSDFRSWLRAATVEDLQAHDAAALGALILERRWRGAVDDLLRLLRHGREDVRPALAACVPLIGRFTQLWHGLTQFVPADRWQLLEALAEELYPEGPNQDNLWEQAGGRKAMLDHGGRGRSQWHAALRLIRKGGDAPPLTQLLHTMRRDFPKNSDLKALISDREQAPELWER